MKLLEVRDLTIEYHVHGNVFRAVENLSFSLEPGRSLGLMGESGCGKTTAMLGLMRLLPEAGRIVSGQVLFEGTDLLRLSIAELCVYRWGKISMVFQGAMNALNPVYTVGSQIAEAIRWHNTVPNNQIDEEVDRLLDLVGLSPSCADRYPHQYSGGMRQRAMIAMALACRPKVVIADEPTTALDVMVQAQILDLLQKLQQELNLAIILVTHDLGVVAELCDDVLVMYGGWMAEYADIDTIFNESVHPYTRQLLHAFPNIDDPRNELASIPGSPPLLDNLPPGCRFEPRCGMAIEACKRGTCGVIEITPGHLVNCRLVASEGRCQDEEFHRAIS
jgi:peptide/nickel transport system ATP-binding protein